MIYRKNVGLGERLARGAAGSLMIACGIFGVEATLLGRGLIVAGSVMILTGVVGFCPACAAVGRKVAEE